VLLNAGFRLHEDEEDRFQHEDAELGPLAANSEKRKPSEVLEEYRKIFLEALSCFINSPNTLGEAF